MREFRLRIAFKWMMRAFSGYLASNQLLALWDRILAFDSLEILPVLAVSIFIFRQENVLTVSSETAIEVIDHFSPVCRLDRICCFSRRSSPTSHRSK